MTERVLEAREIIGGEHIWVGNGLLTEPGGFLVMVEKDGTLTINAAREDGRIDWLRTTIREAIDVGFAAQGVKCD